MIARGLVSSAYDKGVRITVAYEIRLLNADGSTAMLYITQCANDEDAMGRVHRIADTQYDRYEIWQDFRKVGEGPRPPDDGKDAP